MAHSRFPARGFRAIQESASVQPDAHKDFVYGCELLLQALQDLLLFKTDRAVLPPGIDFERQKNGSDDSHTHYEDTRPTHDCEIVHPDHYK